VLLLYLAVSIILNKALVLLSLLKAVCCFLLF
jgi:hypothetical protein